MPKISVCISFYNCESFLSSFVNQLFRQSCQDFECILVDDGSTDNGVSIVKSLIKDKPQYKLVSHTENIGLGAGRVTGINNSTAEYVTFMDCDDEISADSIKMIIEDIEKSPDTELFVYNYAMKKQNGKIKEVRDYHESYSDYFYKNSPLINHVWHKVYKKSLFRRMALDFYRTISFSEDLYLTINCFLNTDSIKFIDNIYYTYKYNCTSMVHNRSGHSIYENIEVVKELLRNPRLSEKQEIFEYIKKDSFNCFGMLIYPNLYNEFQRTSPHFIEWLEIDGEFHLEIPKGVSTFCRFYIGQIRKKHYAIAHTLWKALWIKRFAKKIFLKG